MIYIKEMHNLSMNPPEKTSGLCICRTFKEKIILVLLKLFQIIGKEKLANSLCAVNTTLILIPDIKL